MKLTVWRSKFQISNRKLFNGLGCSQVAPPPLISPGQRPHDVIMNMATREGPSQPPTQVKMPLGKDQIPTGAGSNTLLLISASDQALLLSPAILLCQPRGPQGQVMNVKQVLPWGPSFLQKPMPLISKMTCWAELGRKGCLTRAHAYYIASQNVLEGWVTICMPGGP